eukprot:5655716-Lingulodinium_polyedra.AAC.1
MDLTSATTSKAIPLGAGQQSAVIPSTTGLVERAPHSPGPGEPKHVSSPTNPDVGQDPLSGETGPHHLPEAARAADLARALAARALAF